MDVEYTVEILWLSYSNIMRLIVRDDAAAAANYVAQYILNRLKEFKPTADRPFVLGLPTGSSPVEVYRILVEHYKAGDVSLNSRCA